MLYMIRSDIAWQEYFGVTYIFDDKEHESYMLEDSASLIWKILGRIGESSVSDIVQRIYSEYPDISRDELKNDIEEFLLDLTDVGLVVKYDR